MGRRRRNGRGVSGAVAAVGSMAIAAVLPGWAASAPGAGRQPDVDGVPACGIGEPLVLTGRAERSDNKTYELVPFEVPEGATRVEVGYRWDPPEDTVLDLGLWDADGYDRPEGFRGWGGSRQGRLDRGMARAWVQADSAERAFTPGPVEAGVWHVELGYADIPESGTTWTVEVLCDAPEVGAPPEPDQVDPTHVANPNPGWYRADFHMHSWNSAPDAPDYEGLVEHARRAQLDILPVTEYVVVRHHDELGAVQRANPDLLVWPGREIITYFGHATVFGETPSVVEYRHGFEDVTLGGIQERSVADGAIFGVAHPTVFPEAQFGSTCRGCEFQLGDDIDWDLVTTMEVVTNMPVVGEVENPFITTAIGFWEDRLREGHRITAVSGSDDKQGPDLGSSATMIRADELSRAGVVDALRRGRAYVQVRGAGSPTIEFTATAGDEEAIVGDTLVAESADMSVEVSGGDGQTLRIVRNGTEVSTVPIVGDEFEHAWTGDRDRAVEGPLGTFWRIEVLDDVGRTVISNPIFLADEAPEPAPPPTSSPTTTTGPSEVGADAAEQGGGSARWSIAAGAAVVVAIAVGWALRRRGRHGPRPEGGTPGAG